MNENYDELTLKELVAKLGVYYNELISKWMYIVLSMALAVLFFVYRAVVTPPEFGAELTFMLDEGGGGNSGFSVLLGQFGFGKSKSDSNPERILELSKSRRIVQEILFHKIDIEQKNDFIANHIINFYDYHEKWSDDTTGLQNFLFTHKDVGTFTRAENKVLKTIYSKVVGNKNAKIIPLLKTKYRDDAGIMSLNLVSVDETLSIQFCKLLYERLSKFYVDKTVEKHLTTYNVVKNTVDSIRDERSSLEYRLAIFKDTHKGIYTSKAKLKEMQLKRDVKVVNEAYAAALKNLEISSFSLRDRRPLIQLIDEPIAPITPKVFSIPKAVVLGTLLGGLFAITLILVRRIYYEIIQM